VVLTANAFKSFCRGLFVLPGIVIIPDIGRRKSFCRAFIELYDNFIPDRTGYFAFAFGGRDAPAPSGTGAHS